MQCAKTKNKARGGQGIKRAKTLKHAGLTFSVFFKLRPTILLVKRQIDVNQPKQQHFYYFRCLLHFLSVKINV